jgi:hypothetical protein
MVGKSSSRVFPCQTWMESYTRTSLLNKADQRVAQLRLSCTKARQGTHFAQVWTLPLILNLMGGRKAQSLTINLSANRNHTIKFEPSSLNSQFSAIHWLKQA